MYLFAKQRRGGRLLGVLLFFLILIRPAPAVSADAPEEEKPEEEVQVQALTGARLGTLDDFSRLVLTFTKEVGSYKIRRVAVDEILLEIEGVEESRQGRLGLQDRLVRGVAGALKDGKLKVLIKTKPARFNFRHFSSEDGRSILVDIRSTSPLFGKKLDQEDDRVLDIPSARDLARSVRARLPKEPEEETDRALLAAAMDDMIAGSFQEAALKLEAFKTTFPDSPLMDTALFLLGDAYYNINPDDISENFQKIVASYTEAINTYPNSPEAGRASLMRAMAYVDMEYYNEAFAYLKVMREDYQDSPYGFLAQIKLGEVYLDLGKTDLARAVFDEILDQAPAGRTFFETYYRLGQTLFNEGLFSRANEIFKEILDADVDFYLDYPEILYFMGEGYFYLDRKDLARPYYFHFINLVPDHEYADLIMARIGDTYLDNDLDDQAIRAYSITRKLYPDTIGALVATMRLADHGALRELYSVPNVFNELESGVHEAAIKIYRQIIDADQEVPLVQLAMYKIARAYFALGEYSKAVESLKGLLERFPDSAIKKEVNEALDRTILEGVKNLFADEEYLKTIAFYMDNKEHVSKENWPEIRKILAKSYVRLEMPEEAAELLTQEEEGGERDAETYLGLGESYMKMQDYENALKTYSEFREKYPDHEKAVEALVQMARAELGLERNEQALKHLNEAASADPGLDNDAEIQGMLGELLINLGRLEEGAAAMEKAVAALEDRPEAQLDLFLAYSRLGQAYLGLDKQDEAGAAFDSALGVVPADPFPETLYLIAGGYRKLDRIDKAEETLNLMLSKTRDPFWRRVAEKELEVLKKMKKTSRLFRAAA